MQTNNKNIINNMNNMNNINKDLINEISNDCECMITLLDNIKYNVNNNIIDEKEIKNMINKLFEYRTGLLVNKLDKLNLIK